MTARTRLRRRLLIFSAPAAVLVLLVVLKLVSMVAAGNSAVGDYAAGDVEGLAGDVAVLQFGNVVEGAKAPFAAGTLAVLDGRLADADAAFGEALRRTDPAQSCPIRLNIELVRETQGDLAGFARAPEQARERYTRALAAVEEAPPGCFAGNDDPDPERRAVRADAAERLTAKIANVEAMPPPPPPPPPPPAGAPPPPPPPDVGPNDEPEPDAPRRLDPRGGDPLERLQQVLRDAAEAAPGG